MTDLPDDPFERLLRSGLGRHAADAPDDPDLTGVRVRAARHHRRRIVGGAGLATTVLVVAVALVFVVGSSSGAPTSHEAISTTPHAAEHRSGHGVVGASAHRHGRGRRARSTEQRWGCREPCVRRSW